jgi:hypothetical protein
MRFKALSTYFGFLIAGTLLFAGPAASGMLRPNGVVYPADPAGLLERLLAGNIDQPGSRAFIRWGAGYDQGIQASDRKFGQK